MKPVSLSVFGLAAALWASPALAQETRGVARVLVDRKLHEQAVSLTGIDNKTVMYSDAAGLVRTETLGEYLAVLSPTPGSGAGAEGGRPAPHPSSILELRDGQRFVGALSSAEQRGSTETVLWEHAALGLMEFKLDEVRSVRLQAGLPTATRRAGDIATDVVMLVNGDRLEGFVDAVGPVVTIDVNGAKRELPAERVQEVMLAGSGAASSEPVRGLVAWLSDGTVVACRGLQTTRVGELILTPRTSGLERTERGTEAPPPAPTVSLRLDDLWALAVDPAAIVPLASLHLSAQTPGAGRRWSRGIDVIEPRWAALGLADIELPGPMNVEWDLPPGATRFACDAEMPRQMWTWGDCEVVVSVLGPAGESELLRKRLNAESPRTRVSLAVAGAKRLRVRVEAGEFGSVQDKVILRRGVILAEPR